MVSVEPIFVVSDIARAVAHYEQLGFSTSHHDEGYAFAHRNELTIHLAGPGIEPEQAGRGFIYMHVDDADALAEEWRVAGIDFIEPQDFEWASVSHIKTPTGTSFASAHRCGVSCLVVRAERNDCDPGERPSRLNPAGCKNARPCLIDIPEL